MNCFRNWIGGRPANNPEELGQAGRRAFEIVGGRAVPIRRSPATGYISNAPKDNLAERARSVPRSGQ